MNIEDITKEDFAAYERVRKSGRFNMKWADAARAAGISRETKVAIIKHYEALCAKWPDIRDLAEKERA